MILDSFRKVVEYAQSGLVVIPVGGYGDGKRPAVKWKGFYTGEEPYDVSSLESLFLKNDSVAVITGSCSGNL